MADARTPRAVHPPFFALHAPLAVYAANVSLIAWPAVVKPAAAILGTVLALWAALFLIVRNANASAAAASAAVFATFSFGPIVNALGWAAEGAPGFGTWALFAVLAGWGAYRLAKAWSAATTLLNVAGVAMCLLAVGSVVSTRLGIRSHLRAATSAGSAKSGGGTASLPDIVLVVLDGYGRTDTFERLYGFSDKAFVEALKERGFYVAERAHSNYSQTELSLASSLNLEPIQTLVPPGPGMEEARGTLDALIQDSAVARRLKAIGYKTVAITSGFPALNFRGFDLVLGTDGGDALYLDALLEKTPFRRPESSLASQFDQRRNKLLAALDHVGDFATPSASPRFVIAHILAPHPPFVFAEDGSPIRPKGPYGLWDGNHFLATIGDAETYRSGYRRQAQFIAQKTLAALDRLLAGRSRRPIVVVQGDHGPKSKLNQDEMDGSDLDEAYGILNAYYVPEEIRTKLYPEVTPVNTWRLILGSLLNDPMALVPDRSYYATWSDPLRFIDITPRLSGTSPARRDGRL